MGRGTRHTRRLEATKEIFGPVIGNVTYQEFIGSFAAILVDTDADEAYVTLLVPWDYAYCVDCAVVLIPNATTTPGAPMDITVNTSSPNPASNQQHFEHNDSQTYDFATTVLVIQEVSVKDQVDKARCQAGDYLAFRIHRATGQTTNAYIVGVRFRYHVKSGSMP